MDEMIEKKQKDDALRATIISLIKKYRVNKGDYFLFEEKDNEDVTNIYICQMLSSKDKLLIDQNNLIKSDAIDIIGKANIDLKSFEKIFDMFGQRNQDLLNGESTALRGSLIYNEQSNDSKVVATQVMKLTRAQCVLAVNAANKINQDNTIKQTNQAKPLVANKNTNKV